MQRCILAILTLAACAGAQAASESVDINLVTSQSVGQAIGSVKISETAKGLEFTPDLKALPPGEHGFHIHANGSCQPAIKEGKAVAAGAAGGHYDPQKPVSMKVPTAPVTSAICRSWWSITTVKQPSRRSRRA